MKTFIASFGQTIKVNRWYILAIFILLVLHLFPVLFQWPSKTSCFYQYVDGFNGNLIAGILGGLLFLVIAIWLNKGNERLIEKSAEILKEQEKITKIERTIKRFESFLEEESYHDFCFPELKHELVPFGLIYTLEPVRDEHGKLIIKKGEMNSYYLVKVRRKQFDVLPETKPAYDSSPIKENEYYYCAFYNGSWHMGQEALGDGWYAFQFYGKVGQVEHDQSANEFLGKNNIEGLTLIEELRIERATGNEVDGYQGFTPHRVLRRDDGNHYLQIWDSVPKIIYYCDSRDNRDNYELQIDDIRGYYHGDGLKNLLDVLSKCISKHNLEIKKFHYWELGRER